MKICLDTNILLNFNLSLGKFLQYKQEYNDIIQNDKILTKWVYIFFSNIEQIASPLTAHEYIRILKRNNTPFKIIKETMAKFCHKFNTDYRINETELILSILFCNSTGLEFDDAYHYLYALKKNADYFATKDKQTHEIISNLDKNIVFREMIKGASYFNPFQNKGYYNIHSEIEKIIRMKWCVSIRTPMELLL